jgi:hypothetical protein
MTKQFLLKLLVSGFLLLLVAGSYAQLSIPDTNPVTINFTGFTGTGYAPDPAPGQLDSDDWIATGFDSGTLTFGGTQTSGDFARGSSSIRVTTGGVYAFDVGTGNVTLGVQPGGTDWTPGSFILRIQNKTGNVIGKLDVGYSIFVMNDQARGNKFNFSHSPDNVNYTNETSVNYVSPDAADVTPAWTEVTRNISLVGININPDDYYYLSWNGDDATGSGSRDEFGLDNISLTATLGAIDINPPVFSAGTPRSSNVGLNEFDIVVNLDEIGTVYYLVKNHGEPAPTRTEVRLADTLFITDADTNFSKTIDTVSMGTIYDVYFLAEDDETVPNVQDTTTLLEVKTKVPRMLNLLTPVGGENFYVGDTTVVRWESDAIDSIKLWVFSFEEQAWMYVLGDENAKIYAEQDSLIVPIPKNAGLDSSYFRIMDADDHSFYDSTGIFYLTDTIHPQLLITLPADNQVDLPRTDTLAIAFDERVFPNAGWILVNRKPDHSIFDSINVNNGDIVYYHDYLVIHLKGYLENGTEYYVTISPGAFVDYQGNAFAGIQDDTTWTFSTIGNDIFISEYLEGSSNNKALEIANTTGTDVDLSNYQLWRANSISGSVSWNNRYDVSLSGILKNDSVFVICNANASADIKSKSDVVGGVLDTITWFNGDDAVGIAKLIGGNWILLDAIGMEGPDPGTAWSVAGTDNATADHTLLRKSYVKGGNIDWMNASGSNTFDSEWKVYAMNNHDNLGLLTMPEDTIAEVLSFTLAEEKLPAVIDSAGATIDVTVVKGTKLDRLYPVIVVSAGAGIEPASGDSTDFSKGPVLYTVTAEDHVHKKIWTVTVTEEIIPSNEKDILTFVLSELAGDALIDTVNHMVTAKVVYGTSLVSLSPAITVSAAATIDPASGVARDFTDTVSYLVTAQDSSQQVWKVVVTVEQPVEVSTVADLRAGLQDGTIYKLTGEVILTARFTLRNQKYIQDGTAGILIDDYSAKITTSYNIGDGITGIVGTLLDYRGMLEFTPMEDPGTATSTGNPIIPIDLTIGEFLENSETYESRIIKFTRASFVDAGSTFEDGKNYKLVQDDDTTIFRTQYYNLDYEGTVIPGLADVTAIGYNYYTTPEVVSRSLADIVEVILSSEKDILTFVLAEQTGAATINTASHTVDIEVANGTNVTALSPVITVSEGATINPESGTATDFTNPVTYTVTAEDGSAQTWTVTVSVAVSVGNDLLIGKVNIYPNPNNGRFYITLNSDQPADFTLQVISPDGRIIYSQEYHSVTSVNEFTDTMIGVPGIYTIRILSGSSVWTEKLVIQ